MPNKKIETWINHKKFFLSDNKDNVSLLKNLSRERESYNYQIKEAEQKEARSKNETEYLKKLIMELFGNNKYEDKSNLFRSN